jgi:hypothetical protein
MPDKQHWPFGQQGPEVERERERELERLRRDEASEVRKRIRFDSFIVGGRGHVKKRGLS